MADIAFREAHIAEWHCGINHHHTPSGANTGTEYMTAVLITPEEACARLDLTPSELQKAVRDDVLSEIRLGKRVRYFLADIEALDSAFS